MKPEYKGIYEKLEELRELITKQDLRYSQTVELLAKVLEVEKALGLSEVKDTKERNT
jgi:hypothetical protein